MIATIKKLVSSADALFFHTRALLKNINRRSEKENDNNLDMLTNLYFFTRLFSLYFFPPFFTVFW